MVCLAALSNDPLGDLNPATTYSINLEGTIRLARAGAFVQAVDFSEAMLVRGQSKAAGLKIDFHKLDLTRQLPFADASFDAVFIGYGLRNFPDLKKAVR